MLTVTEQHRNGVFIVVRTGGIGAGGRKVGRGLDRDSVAPVNEKTAMGNEHLYSFTEGTLCLLGEVVQEFYTLVGIIPDDNQQIKEADITVKDPCLSDGISVG